MKKKRKVEAVLLICILFISIFNIPVVKVKAEDNMNYPKELMLGTFFNSEKHLTDIHFIRLAKHIQINIQIVEVHTKL